MSSSPGYDVIVIGGGPSGAVTACMLAQAGWRTLILERDIHPREHIGESLNPATNIIWERIGFRPLMERAGFVHKPGATWTAPRTPPGRYLAIRLNEVPCPGAPAPHHTYNVERDVFDAMLLRHAHEEGAEVLQGLKAGEVLFEDGRAVGVRAIAADGWERELRSRYVVDASGRRCLLANQLGLKRKDPAFNQFAVHSWFTGVKPPPPGTEGMILLHFLDLERSWAWQIPLRNGVTSVGVVTEKADFQGASGEIDRFFSRMLSENNSLRHHLDGAVRTHPLRVEADYSYKISRFAGPGWVMVGDAVRFVDPVFSTGMDVAVFSAEHCFEALDAALRGADERTQLERYEGLVSDGIEVWYELISLFYRLRNLFTFYAVKPATRKRVVSVLQGNPYRPETQQRARELISLLEESHARVSASPGHLLSPGGMRQAQTGTAIV